MATSDSTLWLALLFAVLVVQGRHAAERAAPTPPKASDVVVCLGDSITDGCTYPQIIVQALKEARRPVPVVVCAGVAGNTAAQMAARLAKSVLAFKPNVVTFCAGTNDSLHGVTAADYERSLRQISQKVKAQGGMMILLTPL